MKRMNNNHSQAVVDKELTFAGKVHGVTYDDLDAEGRPYSMTYVLTLVFARVDGSWLLLHDQNTPT